MDGGKLTVCFLDLEPVLADVTGCDRFEQKEAEQPLAASPTGGTADAPTPDLRRSWRVGVATCRLERFAPPCALSRTWKSGFALATTELLPGIGDYAAGKG